MYERPTRANELVSQLANQPTGCFIFTNGAKLAQNNGKEGNTKTKHTPKSAKKNINKREDLTFKNIAKNRNEI